MLQKSCLVLKVIFKIKIIDFWNLIHTQTVDAQLDIDIELVLTTAFLENDFSFIT